MENNKKILMVTPYYYPSIGGVQNYVRNISEGLKNMYKWEVVVVTTNHNENKYKEELINGIKIYRLPYWFKLSNTPINPLWYLQIKKIIQKEKPDVINAHTPVPFLSDIVCLIKGNKQFILTYHNDLLKNNLLLKIVTYLYYFLLGNRTIKNANKIIATSGLYVNNSVYLKNHKRKIEIITPGVDLKLFNHKNIDKNLQKKYSNNKVVLFIGNLDITHSHKGLNYLIEAINEVKSKEIKVKLVVVGNGDGISSYRSQVKSRDLNQYVDFYENVKTSKLSYYYNISDAVVLPSTNRSEGFGIVLIEAMACKKPVIGSKIGGIPYVIDHEVNGLLFPPKNSKQIAKVVMKILSDEKLAKRLEENGYKKVVDNFTLEIQIEKTNQLFKTL